MVMLTFVLKQGRPCSFPNIKVLQRPISTAVRHAPGKTGEAAVIEIKRSPVRQLYFQLKLGVSALFMHSRSALSVMVLRLQKGKEYKPTRRDVRTLAIAKRDWVQVIPHLPFLPVFYLTVPCLVRFFPRWIPVVFRTQFMQIKIDCDKLSTQKALQPVILDSFKKQLCKCARSFKSDPYLQVQYRNLQYMLSENRGVCYSKMIEVLPLLQKYSSVGLVDYKTAVVYAQYLKFPVPHLVPKTRLLRFFSELKADDAMLLMEPQPLQLAWEEYNDAFRMRSLMDLGDPTGLKVLQDHAKWTAQLQNKDVLVWLLARALNARTYDE